MSTVSEDKPTFSAPGSPHPISFCPSESEDETESDVGIDVTNAKRQTVFSDAYFEEMSRLQIHQNANSCNHRPRSRTRSRSRSRSRSSTRKPLGKPKALNITNVKFLKPATHIPKNSTILFFGRRRSGKSSQMVTILDILCMPRIIIIGANRDAEFWSKYIGLVYFYDEWDPSILVQLMKDQKSLLELIKKPGFENFNIDVAVILEDMSFDKQVMHSKCLADLLCNGTRLHILFLVSAQHMKHMLPASLENIDIFLLFATKTGPGRKALVETVSNYTGLSPEGFLQIYDATTMAQRSLVIRTFADKQDDNLLCFKANVKSEPRLFGNLLTRMFNELYLKKEEEISEIHRRATESSPLENPQLKSKIARFTIPEHEIVPVNEIEQLGSLSNVFEMHCTSGKNEQHIISFSFDDDNGITPADTTFYGNTKK